MASEALLALLGFLAHVDHSAHIVPYLLDSVKQSWRAATWFGGSVVSRHPILTALVQLRLRLPIKLQQKRLERNLWKKSVCFYIDLIPFFLFKCLDGAVVGAEAASQGGSKQKREALSLGGPRSVKFAYLMLIYSTVA